MCQLKVQSRVHVSRDVCGRTQIEECPARRGHGHLKWHGSTAHHRHHLTRLSNSPIGIGGVRRDRFDCLHRIAKAEEVIATSDLERRRQRLGIRNGSHVDRRRVCQTRGKNVITLQ